MNVRTRSASETPSRRTRHGDGRHGDGRDSSGRARDAQDIIEEHNLAKGHMDKLLEHMTKVERRMLEVIDINRRLQEDRAQREKRDAELNWEQRLADLAEKSRRQEAEILQLRETSRSDAASKDQKIAELQGRVRRRDEENRILKERLVTAQESSRNKDSSTRRDRQPMDLQIANQRQERENQSLKEQLRLAEQQLAHTSNLLQVRTVALQGVETFLDKADRYSGSEIIAMVDTLNAEIFQMAAHIADLHEDPSMVATAAQRQQIMSKQSTGIKNTSQHIGKELFDYLVTYGGDAHFHSLPLQLALQSLITRWCNFMTQRFSGDSVNDQLTTLHDMIQKSGMLIESKRARRITNISAEPQGVAGRWRAITYSHMKAVDPRTFSEGILDMILILLAICGWHPNSPKSSNIRSSIQRMLATVEKQWTKLKAAMKEGITTSDMEVFVIDFGKRYDESMMEDSYPQDAQPGRSSRGRVLCTIGMGLRKTEVNPTKGGKVVDLLLKPTVALENILLEEMHT